jgi:formylglycine-generating enzyme required for sulfatase activity/outer membrane protein OmpA-like peptidoglycan-associated protein
MKNLFFWSIAILIVTVLSSTAGCTGSGQTQKMTEPAPFPSGNTHQASTPMPQHESITSRADHYASSYNRAIQDKESLRMAASKSDYQKSQDLIRSYNQHMNASKDSYHILQEIAEKQGTGDITIFFPTNSAVILENDLQYTRLIRYLDSLERNNRGRKLVFVIMGSASSTGEENHNLVLSKARAQAAIPIIDHYLINVPHTFHKVYGTGETDSPKNVGEDINKRYQFVRIMALYEEMSPQMTGTIDFGAGGLTDQSGTVSLGQPSEYTNSIGMKFIRVPAGTFMMGSPDTEIRRSGNEILHQVTLTQPYYLQSTEVTQQQWFDVMGTYPSHFENCGMRCPVENVRYSDVMEFIKRLNEMENTIHYRLPTEAEWEYAARAGTTSAFFNGPMVVEGDFSTNPYLDEVGWYYRNSGQATRPVALKSPNPWGFYDMHGNVWEWCSDWQRPYSFYPKIDPQGAQFAKAKIRRGGSWAHYPEYCRSAYRSWFDPEDTNPEMGFRVAITKLERIVPSTPRPVMDEISLPEPAPPVVQAPKPKAKPRPKPDPEPIPMPGPAEITHCIVIRDISFDFDSSRIKDKMRPVLDRAIEILTKYDGKIELHGHTCSMGSKAYNMALGLKRAESVKSYLVSKGIKETRISVKSFGEESPKYTNMTETGRSLNRRVEILLHGLNDEEF